MYDCIHRVVRCTDSDHDREDKRGEERMDQDRGADDPPMKV
jgi:hypothetical protein